MKKTVFVVLLVVMVMATLVPSVFAAPPSAGGYWYYVNHGDTLYGISRYTGVSTQAIISANGIAHPNWIYAGTSLWIPACNCDPGYPGNPGNPGNPGYRYHTVRWGENLLGIGRYYGISAWSIANANGIYNLNYIYAGQVLVIP